MRTSLKLTDLGAKVRQINKLGKVVDFSIYLVINSTHLECRRFDGELIFKFYNRDNINLDKAYYKLSRLALELEHFILYRSTPFTIVGKRVYRPIYYIYFNY